MNLIKELLNDERGAALAEYAILNAVIAVGMISVVTSLRNSIIQVLNRATAEIAAVL